MTNENPRITTIEHATLEGTRPRPAGSNARLGPHGSTVRVAIARVTTEDGESGFGVCRLGEDALRPLLGMRLNDVFTREGGTEPAWRGVDFPLWDLAAKRAGQPVYALAAAMGGGPVGQPPRVPCYDTSLYFDDLHLEDDAEAAALLAAEAQEGYDRGHRAFKIKVGRGGRHLPTEAGTRRDIAVVHAVRAAVGSEATLLLDANNGYTLNLTKRVLTETAACRIGWIEEAFHEDAVLYRDLKEWLGRENLPILIADGEGDASANLLTWAREGIVDVVQYDIFGHGFTTWLATGRQLDAWGARTAPHHYGGHLGNVVTGHLAPAVDGFTYVEWDEATTPGIDTSRYTVADGHVTLPDAPGFGIDLDDERFRAAVAAEGGRLRLKGGR